ncbi:hypothetical protein ACET3Z_019634 [Daucus carota]
MALQNYGIKECWNKCRVVIYLAARLRTRMNSLHKQLNVKTHVGTKREGSVGASCCDKSFFSIPVLGTLGIRSMVEYI